MLYPQNSAGFCFGLKIYCMYTKPVSDIIQWHGLSHHSYAYDTQLYMTMDHSSNDWRDGLARIELCVSEIREWVCWSWMMTRQNSLCLHTNISRIYYNDLSITIGDTVADCSSQVRDLGIIFDRVLSVRQHVSYTTKTGSYHLRNISWIRKYILQETSLVLIKLLEMSRLDYSNIIFYLSCTYCNLGETARSWLYVTCIDGVALVLNWQDDWV